MNLYINQQNFPQKVDKEIICLTTVSLSKLSKNAF